MPRPRRESRVLRPEGDTYGIPTYPYHLAPDDYFTRRQLRKLNLCPGGQPIQAQIIWKHKGIGKNGRGSTTRRVAYLYSLKEAKPKRESTPAQLEAVEKALRARRTCPTCGVEQAYYIPRSRGECNDAPNPNCTPTPAARHRLRQRVGWRTCRRRLGPGELCADAQWQRIQLDLEAS